VAEKVKRRLQHFIDRKIAALFEPLLAMSRDEALTGLARGFAFRLVEGMGILPREGVANEVKELDQEARGSLRKHGVRFGQYTIFQQQLLKPAPTRLRLVLHSLWAGLQEFPESPPPGLVTIPNITEVPAIAYTLSGYRQSGARAIRIDMLERLADLLRGQDSRGGFEAVPDMLSITGMTLEQFADLMGGLGYKGERGERVKVKAEAVVAPKPADDSNANPIPEEASPVAEDEAAKAAAAAEAAEAAPEMEVFYTFTWAPRPRGGQGDRGNRREGNRESNREGGERKQGGAPRGDKAGGNRGEKGDRKGGGKPRGKDNRKPKTENTYHFEARPPKKEKPIDPDNPFAVLMALKDKK
jgi:ATP-dependent RNA helicase SUPV3L1/SUV3